MHLSNIKLNNVKRQLIKKDIWQKLIQYLDQNVILMPQKEIYFYGCEEDHTICKEINNTPQPPSLIYKQTNEHNNNTITFTE